MALWSLWLGVVIFNKSYPDSVAKLAPHRLTKNHTEAMISSFGLWLALNLLKKMRGGGLLDQKPKLTYFKTTKGGLTRQFLEHPLLRGRHDKWWIDILNRFTRDASRAATEDPWQYKDAKSAALYRDTIIKDVSVDDHNMTSSPKAMYRVQLCGTRIQISNLQFSKT